MCAWTRNFWNLTVFARKGDLAGPNPNREHQPTYAYTYQNTEHLYSKEEIEGAVLAIPTKEAALAIGSNIANVGSGIWKSNAVTFLTVSLRCR